jgi:hypothetical protein
LEDHKKPLIVLDDDLAKFKEPLQAVGFKVIHLPTEDRLKKSTSVASLITDSEELKRLLCGRVFLTCRPHLIGHLQVECNFGMVAMVTPALDSDIVSKIILEWVTNEKLWEPQECLRLDFGEGYEINSSIISEEPC